MASGQRPDSYIGSSYVFQGGPKGPFINGVMSGAPIHKLDHRMCFTGPQGAFHKWRHVSAPILSKASSFVPGAA